MQVIKYLYATEVNRGTEEEPNIEADFAEKYMDFNEANYAIAKAEAYNSKVTVEEVPDPEDPSAPAGSVWDELDAAYREGVNSAYDQ